METIKDIREKAYKEMLDFLNWFAEKEPEKWKELMKEYNKFKDKKYIKFTNEEQEELKKR